MRRADRLIWGGAVGLAIILQSAPVVGLNAAFDQDRVAYRIQAAFSLSEPQVEGSLQVHLTNRGPRILHKALFFLYPNRFSLPDEGVNDFNRPLVYPNEEFKRGWMEVFDVRDEGRPTRVESVSRPDLPDGCLVQVPIRPLSPGETRTLALRFRTHVPPRFGTFGVFDGQLTMVGGWHPYLAARGEKGAWRPDWPPPLADFDVDLTAPPGFELLVGGRHVESGGEGKRLQIPAVHYLSVITARQFRRTEATVGNTRIVLFQRPARRTSRMSFGGDQTAIRIDALRDIVSQHPPGLPALPPELVVIEAPLRLVLTAAGEGAVIISDRTLKAHSLIRPFHELQVAQAAYMELLRETLATREPSSDYWWVVEGLGRALAQRSMDMRRPDTWTVYDWIEFFNIFAIVDRFESAPQIPFVESFFEGAREADPLHSEITTFNNALPPGRVILGKLREFLGTDTFQEVIDRCAIAAIPFRSCATKVAGRDLGWLFVQWLKPYPEINYRFDAVELNERSGSGFHSKVSVRRESSRPVVEPATVRLRSIGGRNVDLRWDGTVDLGDLEIETPYRVWQAVIDPERRLIEDRRDDNAVPFSPQIVLDTANVEVTSTEFGIAGLVVGRSRYDYRKDLAVAGLYTNRGVGFTAGARYHWGAPIDATRYRHNAYLFYGFQALDDGFVDERQADTRTTGQLASLGLRYDYTNVFSFENPSRARNLRLYADWYDEALGSNFDYVAWGVNAAVTQPLWSYRSMGALEILNGFSEPLHRSAVPNQGLYSLGGSRSIRGIGAEEELGRNILLIRTELRQSIYPEVDLSFFDLAILRRFQVRFFVDAGRVNDAAGRVYDLGGFAAGAGVGLGAVYEFMGFFPSLAYVEVATRVDEASELDNVQFLFGTRQPF